VDTISGLPAHPLLVHIPVILLPLAAVGVILMAIKPAWHHRYRWATLVVGAAGTIGAVLAAEAGESLDERLHAAGITDTWHDHAEAGDLARGMALLFLLCLLAYVLVPWYADRRAAKANGVAGTGSASLPKWLKPVLTVAVIVAAAASMVTIVNAGHSGAKSVWNRVSPSQPNNGG
jgi:hypothetical protein